MLTVHPRTYLKQVQSPSPIRIFFILTKSLVFPGNYGKIHLRDWIVPSNSWCCRLVPPCTDVMMSSMYQYIWVRLSWVCGGPGPALGIFVMVSYPGTRSNVLKLALVTSVGVSEKSQKNLGYSTHPICSTILIQMMTQFSSADNFTK